ncbi:MAG: hypothetical protein H6826_04000 [Planctomycetes bacterium]|nr:hypothetical protein [Planctomycetota bacterium]
MSWESELFEAYSFPFARRAYTLEVSEALLSSGAKTLALDLAPGATSLDLFDLVDVVDEWDELHLTIRIGEDEAPPPAGLWLQVLCADTRIESVSPVSDPQVRCSLSIADLRGTALVRVLGVCTSSVGPRAGLVVADSAGVLVRLDAPREPFGSGLRTQWDRDFFVSRSIPGALACVDFPPDEEPCLYLNSGIEDFQSLLASKMSSGPIAATRQLLLDQIEVDTWFALGRQATAQMYSEDANPGDPLLEDADLADGWQGLALGRIATLVALGKGESGRAAVAERFIEASAHEEMRGRLASSVSRNRGLADRVRRLAQALGRTQRDAS